LPTCAICRACVAESPVGKAVDVVVIRKRQGAVTVKVTLGRLEDSEQQASVSKPMAATDRFRSCPMRSPPPMILGMTLAELDDEGRVSNFAIADDCRGAWSSPKSIRTLRQPRKRIEPGDVIVEIAQEVVSTPAGCG
jgi:serine protease Do